MDGSTMQFVIQDTIGSGQEIFVLIGNFVAKENTDYTLTSNVNGTTTIEIITTEYGVDQLSATNTLALTVQKTTIGGSSILSRFSYTVTTANASATSFEISSDINYQDIGSYYISIANASSLTKAAGKSKRAKIIITNTPTLSAGTVIKKDPSFPTVLTLTSATNPVFIEVWRHSLSTIYMRYLGQFA
jgi:hypothetical protein